MQNILYQGKRVSLSKAIDRVDRLIRDYEFEKATPLIKKILEAFPNLDVANQMMGIVLGEQGELEAAIKYAEKAVALSPKGANFINTLANYVGGAGDFERAEKLFLQALEISPGMPDAVYNLGKLLISAGRYTDAEAYLQQSLLNAPDNIAVYQNLGANAFNMKSFDQALLWFKLALNRSPQDPDVLYNIGCTYAELSLYDDAIAVFNNLLEVAPYRYEALMRLALCHFWKQEYKAAELFVSGYLENCPKDKQEDRINALTLMASLKKVAGNQIGAIEIEKKIVEEYPSQPWTFSNLLLNMVYTDEISQEELYAWHVKYAERYEQPRIPFRKPHLNTPDPDKKIKIGYLSADFFNHAVSYLSLPLIARHNKKDFEIHCYSSRKVDSVVTRQFQKEAVWHDIDGLVDSEVAKIIQEDQIDILVDLSGHTGGNQLLTLARKPAPIQIMWMGYPFTSGLQAMDYRIVDYFVEPEGMSDHLNTEKLFRLEHCFCAYRPSIAAPERLVNGDLDIKSTPALENGFITFGCCNNVAKLTDFTLDLWSQILEKTPGAKLLLEIPGIEKEHTRLEIEEKLSRNGIAIERVILSNRAENKQYDLYHQIDIALDPFPCNGGNTTCDTLFMSVPIVSLSGERYMSRIGATLISNAGHPEWVTSSPERYIEIACELASDVEKLNDIRQGLREQVESSPLMDEVGFARRMEKAYREIWHTWCKNQIGHSSEHYSALSTTSNSTKTLHTATEVSDVNQKSALQLELEAFAANQAWSTIISTCQPLLEQGMSEPTCLCWYGQALLYTGQVEEAIDVLEPLAQALETDALYWHTLGKALLQAKRSEEAEQALRNACKLSSDLIDAYFLLSSIVMQKALAVSLASPLANDALQETINLLQHIIDVDKLNFRAWCDLSFVQLYRNRLPEAEIAARKALKINKDYAPAAVNLSAILIRKENYLDATNVLKSVEDQSNSALHKNLALAYARMGKIDLAIGHNLQAIELDPHDIAAQDAFLLHSIYAQDNFSDKVKEVLEMYRKTVQEAQPPYLHLNNPHKDRKLRVGFVSGDINNHAVMYLLAPLLELLNQEQFELFIYSNGEVFDEVSVKIRANFSRNWRFTRGVNAEVMAHLVQDDQIDILIDLSGHTSYNFLPAFAMKPAPVQVSWLGYPASTGLHTMDYVLTDNIIFPPNEAKKETWTEQPWRLRGVAFSVYRPYLFKQERHHMPVFQPQPTPALKNGYVTFGSGTNLVRINRNTVALWAEVLKQLPTAKLKLETSTPNHDILELFEENGISANRIEISRRSAETQYRFYNDIDIALDLYPSNGGNTTLDTLWMGVPVVTLTGPEVHSRIGASIMHHLGHPEWVAENQASFVEKAVQLANDIEQLEQIRQSVRPAMKSSVLMDEKRFAQAFGEALRDMWKVWCDSPGASVARELAERNEALTLCADLLQQAEYPAAWDGYRSVLSRWPACGEAMYGLGMVTLLTGDAKSAATFLERAVHLLTSEEANTSLQADCLAALGNALLGLDRMNEAIPYLQHSLALKDSPTVREWLNALPVTTTKLH